MNRCPGYIRILCLLLAGLALAGCAQPAVPAPQEPLHIPEPAATQTAEPTPAPTPAPTPTPEPTSNPSGRERSLYVADLTLDREAGRFSGELWVEYVNTSGDTLYAIPFRLYPNAASPGCLTVTAAALNGRTAYYELEREDLLRLPLALELEPGESCTAYFAFTVTLSESYGLAWRRTELTCPMPVAVGYDGGWLTEAAFGQEGYAQPGEYRVMMNGISGLSPETGLIPAGEGYFTAEEAEYFSMVLYEE